MTAGTLPTTTATGDTESITRSRWAPFRSLFFVALFDQVADCRLLAYVPSVDTLWRWWPFAFSQTRCGILCTFT